jgi:two-component system, NtrC family, sensor kinase
MAWITGIGLWSGTGEPEVRKKASASHGVWLARVGMIAVFSLPLLGGWALLENGIPSRIRSFRLVFTLGAALCMGFMVFARQRQLDRELLRLLAQSRDSLSNLKRLQAQITESEKHASVGQLVGGAAHELNNPITAMMGYSDLLLTSSLNEEQQGLAARIGQHVRRARLLVATLLSFAKQGPASMAPLDPKTVLRTAAKISEPLYQSLNVELRSSFHGDLPAVLADSNQLLQMCVQVLNSAATAAGLRGVQDLSLIAEHRSGLVTITICQNGAALEENQGTHKVGEAGENESSSEMFSRLGLTACQSILLQHRGKISCSENDAGLTIKVELPVIPQERSSATAMWTPQPSA